MGRGFEIGLADAEIDDVAPLALEFGRPGQHGEGVLLPHTREGGIDRSQCSALPRSRPLLANAGGGGKRKTRTETILTARVRDSAGPRAEPTALPRLGS